MAFDEWRRDGFVISTDPRRVDRALTWDFIRTTYWSGPLGADICQAADLTGCREC